jgi:hypothetical protein
LNENYNGSVSSKIYKNIWIKERSLNPHLFKTVILKTFDTRNEATEKENKLQKAVNAPNNPLYINRAFASKMAYDETYNPLKGIASPLRGKKYPKRTGSSLENIRAGAKRRKKMSLETKNNADQKRAETRKLNNTPGSMKGKTHKPETIARFKKIRNESPPWNKGMTMLDVNPDYINPNKGNTISDEQRKKISDAKHNNCPEWSESHKESHRLAVSGSNSNTAVIIEIFDDQGILQHTTHGNFIKYCDDNGLPESALRVSYKNGGSPIKMNHHLDKVVPFRGWYAIKKYPQK